MFFSIDYQLCCFLFEGPRGQNFTSFACICASKLIIVIFIGIDVIIIAVGRSLFFGFVISEFRTCDLVVWDLRFGFCDFSIWYSWDFDFGISDFRFLYLRFEDWICRVWELWIRDVFMSLAMLLHWAPPLSPRRVSPQHF